MAIDDIAPAGGHRRREAGFSMIELIIAAALLALMAVTVASLSVSGADAQEYAGRLNRVTELTQDMVDRMRLELVSSVRQFGNDTEGNANLAVFDLTGMPARLPGSRLATISPGDSLRTDTAGSEITGNSLFFTKLAWTERFVGTSGNEYLIDVYRWVYYYLTPVDGGPQAGRPTGLDLVRVVSEPLADAGAIDRITDATDLEEVLIHLQTATADADGIVHDACDVVWQRGGDPAVTGTLRQIDGSAGTLEDDPFGGRPDPWRVLRADEGVPGQLEYRHHSVATNFSQASFGVGRYGIVSTSGSGFPHGFEVQVVGPSSARQVLLHLVVSSTNRRGRPAWSNVQVVVDGRDL
ncbi:MAG: prepilin-type N-terminal cleavage/methylation domain-containing protein [Planctomycetes bacterium]|nr:prepilin-type N-terminal cleavage/methylation domain-containing protein [Planctomycetota bacterium]